MMSIEKQGFDKPTTQEQELDTKPKVEVAETEDKVVDEKDLSRWEDEGGGTVSSNIPSENQSNLSNNLNKRD